MTFIPLVSPTDLGTYLNDSSLDPDRAAMLIEDSQILCESVVSPLPDGAEIIVRRVAGRAYVAITSPRQAPNAMASIPMGSLPGGMGAVWLSKADKADLRRMAGGSNAFSINMLPADYADALPMWDVNTDSTALETS